MQEERRVPHRTKSTLPQGIVQESWLLADRERHRRLAYPSFTMGLVEFGFEEMEDSNDKFYMEDVGWFSLVLFEAYCNPKIMLL